MKKQAMFFGVLLVGFGLFFLLAELNVEIASKLHTWPTVMLLIGLALLAQARASQDHSGLLAGYILLTLGIHFIAVNVLSFWPAHTGMIPFMISISFLLSSRQLKSGLLQGTVLLLAAFTMMFSERIKQWTSMVEDNAAYLLNFWPVSLLLIGLYLLFFKKK
ncbi:DUF5668 domain-containing protein [Bacillus sp. CGMCC 1.16541]|uniref:LiaF transmembrane domain-containing protein n=1 Tax=Bacillus sp. CGMCC 1.16541 TaxID=2185143 RepID=UPI000D7266B9|nr:DUF5668 domain-containing protein [Bacillus sp. CGMCC 1.16541]